MKRPSKNYIFVNFGWVFVLINIMTVSYFIDKVSNRVVN